MVHRNGKSYSCRLVVSEVVKDYINGECRVKFLERYPETNGSKLTQDQIQRSMIKKYLGLFTLKDG